MSSNALAIAVGVILDTPAQAIYVTRRSSRSHLAGFLEFPGGKVEEGESIEQALERELAEEVGINNLEIASLKTIDYHYPDKHLILHFYLVKNWSGVPFGKEGQSGGWVPIISLEAEQFPPANRPIIEQLKLLFS